ncbi:protein of unknown function [Methylocaldum szegediense]|uniref:Uncharacterized protein n=1 Tax=Methylocaldum szegediense TaxID=73780 RepID=A0ABM9HZQ1_9GAMM|nr:protein of unknown function [Methylocaldum szegediense]
MEAGVSAAASEFCNRGTRECFNLTEPHFARAVQQQKEKRAIRNAKWLTIRLFSSIDTFIPIILPPARC